MTSDGFEKVCIINIISIGISINIILLLQARNAKKPAEMCPDLNDFFNSLFDDREALIIGQPYKNEWMEIMEHKKK